MAVTRYAEETADFAFKGDYVQIDGTLNVDGASVFDEGVTLTAPAHTDAATLTIHTSMTTNTGITLEAPSGTSAGLAWTSGAPAFSNGQMFLVVTAGSTAYRVPIWLNA
jgi:hypothetical protein